MMPSKTRLVNTDGASMTVETNAILSMSLCRRACFIVGNFKMLAQNKITNCC